MFPIGGVILCGGQSQRMRYPKAWLPWGERRCLTVVAETLAGVVNPIVVVAKSGQRLPALPPTVLRADDEQADAGPLEGLRVGLKNLLGRAEFAFVTTCDAPCLMPAVIEHLYAIIRADENLDAIVPVSTDDHQQVHAHVLTAIYRINLAIRISQLRAEGCRRPRDLINQIRTLRIDVESLRAVDPSLRTFQNLNDPAAYRNALQSAGLTLDNDTQQILESS